MALQLLREGTFRENFESVSHSEVNGVMLFKHPPISDITSVPLVLLKYLQLEQQIRKFIPARKILSLC